MVIRKASIHPSKDHGLRQVTVRVTKLPDEPRYHTLSMATSQLLDYTQTLDAIQTLTASIIALFQRQETLIQQMRQLHDAGMTEATTHYRAEKYLYLIHPSTNGHREREYIGADPARQAEALARLDRLQQFDQLNAKLQQTSAAIAHIKQRLDELTRGH